MPPLGKELLDSLSGLKRDEAVTKIGQQRRDSALRFRPCSRPSRFNLDQNTAQSLGVARSQLPELHRRQKCGGETGGTVRSL
jgi:hypothetical protein